ncbi:ABC transporter permease [Streptomyces sp. HUAS ZL42]|uniref:ABC transporter permease n=1 Tax=Streptomyces sp. HUAS ZL42 TaxID=3231715 RepID=UPI00345EEAD8
MAANQATPSPTDVGTGPNAYQRTSRRPGWMSPGQLLSRYALILVWVLLAVGYAVRMPDTFATTSTVQAIFGSQSALLILALAALATLVAGEFDLSFASVMGLAATIVPVLTTLHGVPSWLSCLIAMGVAALCGMINAFFVVVLDVPSLVVTLGSASFFLGLSELVGSATSIAISDPKLTDLMVHRLFGLPLSFYYGVALSLVFAYVLTWTPLGRHIAFVGANRDVARLAGVNVRAVRAGSYVAASMLAGLAGIVIVASVGGFDPVAGSVYLLPSIAAVFLGTAVVHPGQFNPIGTLIGVYFLATGVIGLQLLGYTGWVQNAFYGAGLVLAVSVAALVRRRVGVG